MIVESYLWKWLNLWTQGSAHTTSLYPGCFLAVVLLHCPAGPGCEMRRLPSLKLPAPGSGSFPNYLFCQTEMIIASVFCYIGYALADSICIISLNAQIDR